MSASADSDLQRAEFSSASASPAARSAVRELAPPALCIGAGLTIAFTPVLVWRLCTGSWVCLNDWFSLYYLRFVAQAFYNRVPYISDVVVPGGVTAFPWLQFVPATYVARWLGATPFAVNLIWIFFSAIGFSAGVYAVFQQFLQRPWAAAGCTLYCLSDYGLEAARPITAQLRILASALWFHPTGFIVIPWGLLLQWRVPDPGLNLPFLCLQIVALARARERPSRLNLWISGIAFGLLYYVFFYCWTMVLAGLCIAFLLDRAGRRVYALTLGIGGVIGVPQLIYTIHLNRRASAEAVRRFGMFVPAPRLYHITVPTLSLLGMAAVALWIWKSKRSELIYLWSLVAGGILLGRSRAVTGIYFHEYHYDWQWPAFRVMLVLIAVLSILGARLRLRPLTAGLCWIVLLLYFAGGVYVAAICPDPKSGPACAGQLQAFIHYRAQRLSAGIKPLLPGSMLAGDDAFCDLAAVAEDQWVLNGEAVPITFATDNHQWELRAALNAYLEGTDRAEFQKAAQRAAVTSYWDNPQVQPEVIAAFMRDYDEISLDPDPFIDQFGVRYVALVAQGARSGNLRTGWTMLQPGPYWQVWKRTPSQP